MSNRPELIIEIHPNGKHFIEIESLIEWFRSEPNDMLLPISEFAAYTLEKMKERGVKNPSRVMTEETYYNRDRES